MSQETRAVPVPRSSIVRPQDRLLDAIALLTLAGGVLLFAIGRSQLTALASKTYASPPRGVTWVSRAERHDAQARWGALIAGAGLVLAVGAAIKHTSARRRAA